MRKPPPLLPDEVKKIYAQRWVGLLLQSAGFIMEKIGPQALGEFYSRMAENEAPVIKKTSIPKVGEGALKFALINGILEKNLFGSEVEIPVDGDDRAVLEIKRCALLTPVKEIAEAGLPVTREMFCYGCTSHYAQLADKLNLSLKGEQTKDGCRLTISSP